MKLIQLKKLGGIQDKADLDRTVVLSSVCLARDLGQIKVETDPARILELVYRAVEPLCHGDTKLPRT